MPHVVARTPSKLTRAAIFASTALVAPACWTSDAKVAKTTTTSSPNEVVSKQVDAGTAPVDPETGTVTLVVVANGTPLGGRVVELLGGKQPPRSERTDARGVVTFTNVQPGDYLYQTHDGHPRHSPTAGRIVVTGGQTAQATLNVYVAPYNPNATPMPYGAPPARRRVV